MQNPVSVVMMDQQNVREHDSFPIKTEKRPPADGLELINGKFVSSDYSPKYSVAARGSDCRALPHTAVAWRPKKDRSATVFTLFMRLGEPGIAESASGISIAGAGLDGRPTRRSLIRGALPISVWH